MVKDLFQKMAAGHAAWSFGVLVLECPRRLWTASKLWCFASRGSIMTLFRSLAFFVSLQGAPYLPRKSILDLALAFENGGNWGLERTFTRWALKQDWRQMMPKTYFGLPGIQFLFSIKMGVQEQILSKPSPRFEVTATRFGTDTILSQAKARPVGKRALQKPHLRKLIQYVMPPHEIFDVMFHANRELFKKIFMGHDGAIQHYWSYNQDLAKQVVWPGDVAWLVDPFLKPSYGFIRFRFMQGLLQVHPFTHLW